MAAADWKQYRFPNEGFAVELLSEVILDKCGEGSTAKARFVLLGDWLYLVLAIGRPGIEGSADTARLLGSFTIIAK